MKRYADLAIGFKTAYPRTVASAGIDHNERSPFRIDFDPGWWNNACERVIHGPIKLATVDKKLNLIVEHMRSSFREMVAILIAALAHHVPKQDAALGGIDHVLDGGAEHSERQHFRFSDGRSGRLRFRAHDPSSSQEACNGV